MTQMANNYAAALFALVKEHQLRPELVSEAAQLCTGSAELMQCLKSPIIAAKAKRAVVMEVFSEKHFPVEIQSFIRLVCDNNRVELLPDIFEAYALEVEQSAGIVRALLQYVTKPGDEQLQKMQAYICRKYQAKSVKWTLVEEPSIEGGFILTVAGRQLDWSMAGRMNGLRQKLTRR